MWDVVAAVRPAVEAAAGDDFAFPQVLASVRRVGDAITAYLAAAARDGGVPQPPLLYNAVAAVHGVMGTLGFRTLGGSSVPGSIAASAVADDASHAAPPAAVHHFAHFRHAVRDAALAGVRGKEPGAATVALQRVLRECDGARNVTFPQALGWELKDGAAGPALTRRGA